MNALFGQWQLGRRAVITALVAVSSLGASAIHAKTLGHATVTQVNNDVRFKPTAGNERPAKPKDVVKGADTVRTGQKSQAELEFEDRTITRLGSNSSFSFDPEKREFQLHKGLLLFDMPKNAGGGKIITPAGTAAIEGTAGIVTYRSQPKVICLAGVINVLNPNGQLAARVMPGQLFIIGVTKYPVDFNLSGVKGGKLLSNGLPNNTEEFSSSVKDQQEKIQTGQLQNTPFVVVGDKTDVLVATSGPSPSAGTSTQGSTTPPADQIPPGSEPPPAPPTPPPAPPVTPPQAGTEAQQHTTTPPNTWNGTISSDTRINASTATLSDANAAHDPLSGTVDPATGIATFDAGARSVTITGQPVIQTTSGEDAKLAFRTTGNLVVTGVGSSGQSGSDTVLFHAEANNIAVQNSEMHIDSNANGSGDFYLKAANTLTVAPSVLGADGYRGTTTTPLYDGGDLHLEAGHIINLSGTGWPTGRAELRADGVNGGRVELNNTGSAAGDMVYLRNAGIDATASATPIVVPDSGTGTPDPAPASVGARGGDVNIQSKVRVQMEGTTLIQASGEVPGTISVTASGTPATPGVISLDAKDSIVALLASTFRVANDESFSLITPREVHLGGNTPVGGGAKTIQFSAPGGWALFSAENEVGIQGTTLNVNGNGSQNAGVVWAGKYNASQQPLERTHRFRAHNADILANASTGRGGTISVMADADFAATYETQAIGIGPNTDIQANSAGGGAGTITFSAEGGTARAAAIGFSTEEHDASGNLLQEGFVRLTAVNYTSIGAAPDPGNILIQGATFTDGSKSITLTAKNTLGGQINFNARQSVTVNDTLVDVDPAGPSALWVSMGYYDEVAHQGLPTGRISLTGTLINGNSSGGQGANLWLNAYDQISLQHGTDIQLNGGVTAGYAGIEAKGRSGTPSSPGQVTITATSQRGVRLSAQQTATVLGALAAGEVQILGATTGPSDRSIHIWAGAPVGGICQISITAPQAITLRHALLQANAVSAGGAITLTGNNITLVSALLYALGTGTSSPGGSISLLADTTGTLSLTDSSLLAYGSAGQGGTITLKGGTINFDGVNDINAGSSGHVYIYRDGGSAIPSVTGNLHVLPFSGAFMITSADTLDSSTAQILNGGSPRFTGTLAGDVAMFDFGSANVTVSGNPNIVPAVSGTFNAEFVTQGALLFNNLPEDTSSGGPSADNSILTFRANTISIANSFFKVGGNETGPDSMSFYASGNLLVDPSTLKVWSGPTDGSHAAGLIHLESANGFVAFVGSGYDPIGDPNDLLRSHAQASISLGDGIYSGGAFRLVSSGTHLVPDTSNPYDGVYIHDATVDVRPRDGSGNLFSGTGGQVLLDGTLQVLVEDTVDIFANGTTPGSVTIQSSGNDTLAGLLAFKVPNSTGHIDIEANASSPAVNGGDINILGVNIEGSYSINLTASGPLGGGTIRASAAGGYYAPSSWMNSYVAMAGINIAGAQLNVDAPSATLLAAGQISLEAPSISLADAFLSASSDEGAVGRMELSAKNPGGTRVGTMVNIVNSTLNLGGLEDPNGGIAISGDVVVIDTTSMASFNTGPAQVHIQSRQNTGDWSTNPADPVYWSPLFFIMDDATSIDVSSATPTITGTGGSLNGTFNNSVAVFDFGAQNVLLWPNNPHSTPTLAGLFDVEFYTSGSFESLNMVPGTGGGPSSPLQTARVDIHAAGIRIINSIFNMGDSAALNGPSEFQLFSSTDALVLSPYDLVAPATIIAPKTGMVGTELTGGKFHLESAGITAFVGNNSTRTSKVFVGATDVGGTVEIISTSTAGTTGGKMDGVHLRHAYIDTSHPVISDYPTFSLTPTLALQGGTVTLDGAMQVSITDTTDIYADGSVTAGSIQITSTGNSLQTGRVIFHVEDNPTPGHIYISSQLTTGSSSTPGGNLVLFGATLGDGSKTLNVTTSGAAGGGLIYAEAPQAIFIGNAALDASAPVGSTREGGTIRLRAGASSGTPTGTVALQTYSTELRARGFDGGGVTTIPAGTGPFYLPASLEMHGTVVDVSSHGGTATGNTPQGGNVVLQGTLNSMFFGDGYGSTDIVADGPEADNGAVAGVSAGSIQVLSPGTATEAGNVAINADATHYVRLSAQDSAVVFDTLANGGNIEIHGAAGRASGNETVQITASGPSGAGNITISAIQNLSIINAQLNAGGTLTLNGRNILVQNSLLAAALISINATARADILNSMLQASGISIRAPIVDLAGTTLSSAAQIYANTIVNPPASGTYSQLPYAP
ncbi:MAG: FecR domain-containing protein [Verrucomicrobia bacterium]|nr:FecR domain-containing protein [Verrucomicrobiota bacterium]